MSEEKIKEKKIKNLSPYLLELFNCKVLSQDVWMQFLNSPFIKKLINKLNFEALDVKMQRAKELFYLLEDEEEGGYPGEVPIGNLSVELEAGGLKKEHVQLVRRVITSPPPWMPRGLGPHACSISREQGRGNYGAFVLGKFSRKNPLKREFLDCRTMTHSLE